MIGFSGKCVIKAMNLNSKNKNGMDCVRVLLVDPNNTYDFYRGDDIEFYGEENRKFFSDKKVGDSIGVKTSCYPRGGFWTPYFSGYELRS